MRPHEASTIFNQQVHCDTPHNGHSYLKKSAKNKSPAHDQSSHAYKDHLYSDSTPTPESAQEVSGLKINSQNIFLLNFLVINIDDYVKYESTYRIDSKYVNRICQLRFHDIQRIMFFSKKCQNQISCSAAIAMLAEINPLPHTKIQPSLCHRNGHNASKY